MKTDETTNRLPRLAARSCIVARDSGVRQKRFRLLVLIAGVFAIVAHAPAAFGTEDAEYAAITTRILDRIGTLKIGAPPLDWAAETKKVKVDGTGGAAFSIERNVTWVLERPGQLPSKLNARRAVFGLGGFWIYLTFYRGPWGGAAVFTPVDFGDLHVWLDYGYKDDATAIAEVTKIIEEERRNFERMQHSKSKESSEPPQPKVPSSREAH